jgi:hypothetical protein
LAAQRRKESLRFGIVRHVVQVRRDRIPVCLRRLAGERLHETPAAVDVVPVAWVECVDPEAVEHVDDRLSAREKNFGGPLNGIAGVDQQGVLLARPDVLNFCVDSGETAQRLAAFAVSSARARNQVAMQVSDVNQGDLAAASGKDGCTAQ